MVQIRTAVLSFDAHNILIAFLTNNYQFSPDEINLWVIDACRREFDFDFGYTDQKLGFACTVTAGICDVLIKWYITLDKSLWSSKHHISLEPSQLKQIVTEPRPSNG